MSYSTATRVWYGPESYQHAMFYHPAGHTIGSDPALPCIIYRPGGGWAGADVDDMLLSRKWWLYGLNDATNATHVDTYSVFVLNTASVGYNRTQQVGLTAWVTATAYALGDYRSGSSRLWVCIDAHTSSAAGAGAGLNEPGVGDDWALFWREVGLNETGVRKVPNLGECTPGGLDEMVANCQQFVSHVRRNAAVYGIDPTQVCLAGASAGGQMAGCAAYAEDLAWAKANQVYGANRHVSRFSSRPNAALLSITPVDLTYHTTLGLLNGLYGEYDAGEDAEWVARATEDKRAMSPLWVLKRTGLAVPTCLDYAGSGTHTIDSFAALTGNPYHEADNGGLMLKYLASARPTGLAQANHIFFDDTSAGVYRSRTTYTATTTSAGTSADQRVVASAMLAWLNTAMGV